MDYLFRFMLGAVPAILICLPGHIWGCAAIKGRFARRTDSDSEERLLRSASRLMFSRVLATLAIAAFFLLAMDAGAVHFAMGTLLVTLAAPASLLFLVMSPRLGSSIMKDHLKKEPLIPAKQGL